ncbi:MAG: glycosyltransferase family 2 protein [Candidatus Helarchaeota archaeon]|nr:glycosyltransferase family 2 protein [Candidatus Helarchaeota archaeon]
MYEKIPFDIVDEVLAIDGGSTDGTIEFYKEKMKTNKKLKLLIQKHRGRGIAFLIGAKHATQENIIFFSPDGNENPYDIVKIKHELEKGYDLVIASRFMKTAQSDDSDDPVRVRKMGNLFFTTLVRLFWQIKIHDAINGFRGIKKEKLLKLNQDATEHEIEFQMTIRAAKLKYKIKEIPTLELERIGGARKAKTWRMGIRFTKFFLKELLKGKKFLSKR